jgi:hypothetical protein
MVRRTLIIMLLVGGMWGLACQKNETTGMDASDAAVVAGAVLDGVEGAGQEVNPGRLMKTDGWLSGFPSIGKRPGLRERILKACTEQYGGDTTDLDMDGIPVQAFYSVDCDTAVLDSASGALFSFHVHGRVSAVDNNDQDPFVGSVTVDNPGRVDSFFFHGFEATVDTETLLVHFYQKGSLSADHQQQTFSLQTHWTWKVEYTDSATGQVVRVPAVYRSWSIRFRPQDPAWHPGDTLRDGVMWLGGSMRFADFSFRMATPESLVYSVNCPTPSGDAGPISGLVVAETDQHLIRVRILGCRRYRVELDGQPIQPVRPGA